jgi:hypothetical protein
MIEALFSIFASLPMVWPSPCILDQSCALIPTSHTAQPTQLRRVYEYLVHTFLQGHATHTMHSCIHNVNNIFDSFDIRLLLLCDIGWVITCLS